MPVRRISGKVGVILASCFAGSAAVFAMGAYLYTGPDASPPTEPRSKTRPERARVAASTPAPQATVHWDGIVVTRSPTVERPVRQRAGPQPRPRYRTVVQSSVPTGPPAGVLPRFVETGVEDVGVESPGLPERPTREQIRRAMARIRRDVQRCYDIGMVPGPVVLHLTVAGTSGAVIDSRVSGTSSTATCIDSLAHKLRFPRFARQRVTISYPYDFR